ncbi:ATP-binding cassette domain-containing protein [Bosea sp. NPDC055594]
MAFVDQAKQPKGRSLLSVRGLCKSYGGLKAVKSVSLEIRPGEVVALVGDNGAGKSSFIKMLSGVMMPDEGSMRMKGAEIKLTSPADARNFGIETLHQHLGLVDVFNVQENIFLGRELQTKRFGIFPVLDRAKMRSQTADLLERIGLQLPEVESPVRAMSGGQRQSIAIARLLLNDVKLLIMDEPMAALGVDEGRKVLELIDSLREKGLSVLIISHNLEHVFTIADRIAVMKNGNLVDVVDTKAVDHDQVVSMIVSGRPVNAPTH